MSSSKTIIHQVERLNNHRGSAILDTEILHVVTVMSRISDKHELKPAPPALAESTARRLVCIDPRNYTDGQIRRYPDRDDPGREWFQTYAKSVEVDGNVVKIIIVEPGLD